jgi:hypothetical protein
MNIKANVVDLQLRLEALELLLISRGETNQENLEIFRKQAEENYLKARKEFREKQWAKISLGALVEYNIPGFGLLRLEVISISPEPFEFLAGKIISKFGRLKAYHVGEIHTLSKPYEIVLRSGEILRYD